MCSTNCECDQITENVGSDLKLESLCRKCGSNPFIIRDKILAECKACFLEFCNRKIRSTIGKTKLLRNNDSILIASSGGASSMALLDLIKNSIACNSGREQKFRPSILHIDENIDEDSLDRTNKLKSLLNCMKSLYPDWPLYWTFLEAAVKLDEPIFLEQWTIRSNLVVQNSPREQFYQKLKDLDPSEEIEYTHNLKIKLLDIAAKQINSSNSPNDRLKYIFTANNAAQLATSLLTGVILGRGASARSINVCDPTTSVPIMRPLRDFSPKEIFLYLNARNLEYTVKWGSQVCVQNLTESSLSKLNCNYPATYSTLLRTGGKMLDQPDQKL